MGKDLLHGRSNVYNINYHIVWSVKYRRKVITPEIERFLKDTVCEAGRRHGFTVHMLEAGGMDHIHCFISAPPSLPVPEIVRILKGVSGRKLFESFPGLRKSLWKGKLWNPSYYVETVGSISEETIRRYIFGQDKQAQSVKGAAHAES